MIQKFVIAPGTQAQPAHTPRAAYDENGKLQLSEQLWQTFHDEASGDEFIRRYGLALSRDNFWQLNGNRR